MKYRKLGASDLEVSEISPGSWLTYGLGSENQNMPGFITMCPGGYPIQESQNWQSGFLPGVYAGTYVDPEKQELNKLIEMGVADSARLGLQGQSYGGYATNLLVTQTDRFKAAVTERSICNMVSKWGTSDIGYFGNDLQWGGPPWKNPAFYL